MLHPHDIVRLYGISIPKSDTSDKLMEYIAELEVKLGEAEDQLQAIGKLVKEYDNHE